MTVPLLRAYRNTHYTIVLSNGKRIVLHTGRRSARLDAQLRFAGYRRACIITAWNPEGRLTAGAVNARANRQLQRRLRARGTRVLQAFGVAPDDRWEAEASFLALGLTTAAAICLAGDFRQKAIVVYSRGAAASLWLTQHGRGRRLRS